MHKYLLLLLLISATSARAEWTLTGSSTAPDRRKFVDLKTIQPSGKYLRVWTMYDVDKEESTPAGLKFRSAKQLEELDCARGQGRVLALAFSSGNMGGGNVVPSELNLPKIFLVLRPGSMNEITAHVACNLDTYLAPPKKWEPIGEADGMSLFLDQTGARRAGAVARVRMMYDFTKPQPRPSGELATRSQVTVSEYDCEKRISRQVSLIDYSGQRGNGTPTAILVGPEAPFKANASNDLAETACAAVAAAPTLESTAVPPVGSTVRWPDVTALAVDPATSIQAAVQRCTADQAAQPPRVGPVKGGGYFKQQEQGAKYRLEIAIGASSDRPTQATVEIATTFARATAPSEEAVKAMPISIESSNSGGLERRYVFEWKGEHWLLVDTSIRPIFAMPPGLNATTIGSARIGTSDARTGEDAGATCVRLIESL